MRRTSAQPSLNGGNYSKLIRYLSATGLSSWPIYLGAALGLLSAVFEILSFALLVPTVRGIIAADFSPVCELPILKQVLTGFPGIFYGRNSSVFVFLVLLVFGVSIFKVLLAYFSSLLVQSHARRLSHELRTNIFSRYLSFGKLFYDRTGIARIQQVLFDFTASVPGIITALNSLLTSMFMLTGYVLLMALISWQLTILTAAMYWGLTYGLTGLIRRIEKGSAESARASMAMGTRFHNALSCIGLVKSYRNEKEESWEFTRASEQYARAETGMDKKRLLIQPVQEISTLCMLIALIGAVAYFVVGKKSGDFSQYLVFFLLMRRSSTSFHSIHAFRSAVANLAAPLSGFADFYDDKDKFFVADGTKRFEGFGDRIRFDRLSFDYAGGRSVLEDVSFDVRKGEMTAIVGATGSGKTTLVHLLMRFYDCPPGTIRIDGVDIREYSLESFLAHLAIVSQETQLLNASLRANLIYGLSRTIDDSELEGVCRKARLWDFVVLNQKALGLASGLDLEIGDRGVRLSGGEKQRLSIARAMLKRAEILILDEATSSLDTTTETLIQDAIDEVVKGKTSIVIAHRLSTVRHADKIVVIESGRKVEEGDLTELIGRKGRFYDYWQGQKVIQ